ncbi:MAG: NAD-dependent deacylase [candidate division Zixibacteria bacterium]|nr:NAD-dependent deacylase [candidate division Zixibacteria bacterium]MDD5427168.1 NAD-dependent deacylase [candidate division Zixibacteria bacterium]
MLGEVARLIQKARRGVVLTGAGISAESGVPTFRGKDGLWKQYRAEELATLEAFRADSKLVWEWYNWRRELIRKVHPNPGHYALVEFKSWFEDYTLITQNVDGLHRRAGLDDILELHGNIQLNICVECRLPDKAELDIDPDNIAQCKHCGGKLRPGVVWFGEMLPQAVLQKAFRKAEEADIFFSIGTSALVHPAASLPVLARQRGAKLVEINPDETPLTGLADYYFAARAGELLPRLVEVVSKEHKA